MAKVSGLILLLVKVTVGTSTRGTAWSRSVTIF